eukprot:gene5407-963_t
MEEPTGRNSASIDEFVNSEAAALSRHYVYKYCSPTRRSFLSGRYPQFQSTDNSPELHLDLRMTTIAHKLKPENGTPGTGPMASTPHGRGFDTSLGYMNGAEDHYTHQYHECGGNTDMWDTDKQGYWTNQTYGDY